MSSLRRVFVVMLTFVMSISQISTQIDASQKVELNKTSLTLYVGSSSQLKLKNTNKKIKWSCSKSSVATVMQSGRVKAKKQGSCKVTAKAAGKNYVCRVTVKKKASSTKKHVTYVYVTDTGSKYHRAGCRYLWNSKRKVGLASAKSFGYSACSVCW